jgi:hypothetical protein
MAWAAILVGTLMTVACGSQPPPGPARALFNDLNAIVVTEARTDWVADRLEFEQVGPRALQSGCRTPPADRAALDAWLAGEVLRLGGPASVQFAQNGHDFKAIEPVLQVERVRGALAWLEQHAAADCPFWLPPDPAFAGVQATAGRFVLMLESIGGFQLVSGEGDGVRVGGGGGGRLLPAFGLSDRLTLATGIEIGGTTTFPADDAGNRTVKPAWAAGVPLLARIHAGTWRFDTEATLIARAPLGEPGDGRFGVRVAQGVGVAGLRVSGVMPYVMAWVGHEWMPAAAGESGLSIMRFGTRVGIDWDP